jgi:hypothetical protein
VIDLKTLNATGGLLYHGQIWIDTPQSVEAKVRWARAEGMAGGEFPVFPCKACVAATWR